MHASSVVCVGSKYVSLPSIHATLCLVYSVVNLNHHDHMRHSWATFNGLRHLILDKTDILSHHMPTVAQTWFGLNYSPPLLS